MSLSIPSLFGCQARSTLTVTAGLTCPPAHLPNETFAVSPASSSLHHTILLAASAWTPGAAGVGMASRYLSEH